MRPHHCPTWEDPGGCRCVDLPAAQPTVDRDALAEAIREVWAQPRNSYSRHKMLADALLASGVLTDAAQVRAHALREAARYFEYEMAPAWGSDAHWLSTGSHVADLVAGVLRDRAASSEEASDGE